MNRVSDVVLSCGTHVPAMYSATVSAPTIRSQTKAIQTMKAVSMFALSSNRILLAGTDTKAKAENII
jgi:hypothetical protein